MINSGCTALIGLIVKDILYIASIGDCRGLLLHINGYIDILNIEHSPEIY